MGATPPCAPSSPNTEEMLIVTRREGSAAPPVAAPFFGVELETFMRREYVERFVEEVRGDDPEMAAM